MAAKSKLQLIIELSDKMFNDKLSKVQNKLNGSLGSMKTKLNSFKKYFLQTFSNGGTALAGYFQKAFQQIPFSNLLTNPLAIMTAGAYKLNSYLKESVQGYKNTAQEENKLAQIMQNTMGATKAQTNEIKKLISEQQKIGVVSGTTQTAGSQELSTYLTQKENLEKLIPVMNDMLAQQYGLNASSEQAINIGSMLGKVMDGQTGALSRYGYKFDEVQEKILKTGTEAQRAAVLFDVVNSAVGGVNKALADTPEGKMIRIANEAAGVKDRIGGLVVFFQTAFASLYEKVTGILDKIVIKFETNKEAIFNALQNLASNIASIIDWLVSVIKPIVMFFVDWYRAIKEGNPLVQALTSILGILIGALVTYQLVVNGITMVTNLWAAAQAILNVALTANPIGLIIAAIAALIALVVVIIKKWDEWGAALTLFMGPIGIVISAFKSIYDHWDSIKKAFQTDGILGGLKRIGLVLLDAILKPVQQLLEMLSKIPGLGKLAEAGANRIKEMRERLDLITPGEREKEAKEKTETSLYGDADTVNSTKTNTSTGESVSETVGKANQVRKIDIKIDSFVKGGITTSQSAFKGMSKEDLEAYFKEMFMRVILNAENA